MKFLVVTAVAFGFLVWDWFQNDGAWIGFAVAELDNALHHFGL